MSNEFLFIRNLPNTATQEGQNMSMSILSVILKSFWVMYKVNKVEKEILFKNYVKKPIISLISKISNKSYDCIFYFGM